MLLQRPYFRMFGLLNCMHMNKMIALRLGRIALMENKIQHELNKVPVFENIDIAKRNVRVDYQYKHVWDSHLPY